MIAVFAIDRVTKFFFLNETTRQIFPAILETTYHQNFGLIANFPMPLWMILTFTTIILVVIIWKIIEALPSTVYRLPSTVYALSLIAGGAFGNLFDRLTMGYVFDWILLFNRSVINVADIAIAIGIGWYVYTHRTISQSSCLKK